MNWRNWFGHRDAEVDREIQAHLDLEAEEHSREGMAESNARLAALRAFGNVTAHSEDIRAVWRWTNLEHALSEIRLAFRCMRRRPGFAGTMALTLAAGIGATCVVFSLIDAVLLQPLPFASADRLVYVSERRLQSGDEGRVAPARLADWAAGNQTFEELAGCYPDSVTETSGDTAERLAALYVSPRFFSTLRANPVEGRLFDPAEEAFGGPSSVVISHSYWQRKFGARDDAIGRPLRLGDRSYVVVGIMPASFQLPGLAADLWIPKQASPALMRVREARFYRVFGVLRPGNSSQRAQQDLDRIQQGLAARFPKSDAGWGVTVIPIRDWALGTIDQQLWMLFGAVAMLLLLACANAGALFLVHAIQRGPEMSTRSALGAGSAAVARLLMMEGLAYALLGSAAGMGIAYFGVRILRAAIQDIPRASGMEFSWRVAALATLLCFLTAILFSMAPILHTLRRSIAASLRSGGRGLIDRQGPAAALVGLQFALAAVLLIGAALSFRSLVKLQAEPLGFRVDDVLTLRISASFQESPGSAVERHRRAMETLGNLPGVRSVAAAVQLPGVASGPPKEFDIVSEPAPDGQPRMASVRTVTSTYFDTAGVGLAAGHTCSGASDSAQPFQALVNRAFVQKYSNAGDPIGRTLLTSGRRLEIVGVTADAREEGFGQTPAPAIYVCGPLRFWPDPYFLVRTHGEPAALLSAVRAAVKQLEPARPIYEVRTLYEALSDTLSRTRLQAFLVGLFAALALLLASQGLYGAMSYLVMHRTAELGLRSALGAAPLQILGQVLKTGLLIGTIGSVVGLAVAVPLAAVIRANLYGVGVLDPASYLFVFGVLVAVCCLACAFPAIRASAIDPSRALRNE